MASTLEPTPGYQVWRLAMKWQAAVDRAVAPFELTHAQYSLLASLRGLTRSGDKPSQRELADFTGLDPIFVSKLVRTLEQKGLVERGPHPDDTRAVELNLSLHGTRLIDRAIKTVRSLLDDLLEPLGGCDSPTTKKFSAMLHQLLST
jgi:MarR family transcriptional regulator, organic hydroperoxide resistance regulator